jgi:hypothetical protein
MKSMDEQQSSLVSTLQAGKINLATKDVGENFHSIDSPQLLIRAVKDVESSYSGINIETVVDHRNVKSENLPHTALLHVYLNAIAIIETLP